MVVARIRLRHMKKLRKTYIFNLPHKNSKLFLTKNPNNLIIIKVRKIILITVVITTTIITIMIIIMIK